LGVGAGLLLEGFQLFVSQPLLVRLLGKQTDLEDFRALGLSGMKATPPDGQEEGYAAVLLIVKRRRRSDQA
jgi:hypothetical protein